MAPRASVIIVNWNGLHYLTECLDSLAAQTFRDFEIILVDNGSDDGSIAFVQERYSSVRLISLNENTGFARGNNVGFEAAQGEYLVTLNNDTWVDPHWLEVMVATADSNSTVGMVGCRICTYDDPDRLDSIGVTVCRDGMSRAAFRSQSFLGLGFEGTRGILFPSACAALYRKKMIDEVGGFDDDFFAYCEDTDLGLRGRLAGWKAVAALEAIVLHKYSGTGGVFSPFKLYLVERNHFWAALKNFPVGMLMLLPIWTFMRYLVQMQSVVQSRGAGAQFREASSTQLILALLRGIVDSLKGLPRMLRNRRRIMATRRLSSSEMSRLLNDYRLTFRDLLDID